MCSSDLFPSHDIAVSYVGSEPTDPFICDCHVSVEAVRPMSVSGEPML